MCACISNGLHQASATGLTCITIYVNNVTNVISPGLWWYKGWSLHSALPFDPLYLNTCDLAILICANLATQYKSLMGDKINRENKIPKKRYAPLEHSVCEMSNLIGQFKNTKFSRISKRDSTCRVPCL